MRGIGTTMKDKKSERPIALYSSLICQDFGWWTGCDESRTNAASRYEGEKPWRAICRVSVRDVLCSNLTRSVSRVSTTITPHLARCIPDQVCFATLFHECRFSSLDVGGDI